MYTWGQLKADARQSIWPEGEAPNLVAQHDRAFVDGILDLQQWIECLQQDNTDIIPACSTYYRCGLTVFNAPRGFIKKVSVLGSVSETDPTPDFCSEVEYRQIGPQHIQAWLIRHGRDNFGSALNFASFFCLDASLCRKAAFPVPTDEGLAAGLAPLQLGVHYPQGSTDRVHRSRAGVWAIERGKIYIAPWINVQTQPETVLVVWDGIKRTWGDEDPVDPDPELGGALEEYVRAEDARKWTRDLEIAQLAGDAYQNYRVKLAKNCRDETRVRGREASNARGSVYSTAAATLYYNDTPANASATSDSSDCPSGETAQATASASASIPAGSVSSQFSVADANAKAVALAQTQAKAAATAKLVCVAPGGSGEPGQTWISQAQAPVIVRCTTTDPAAPQPEGSSVTAQVPAGIYTSSISQEDANQQAVAKVQRDAAAQLSCTFWNSPQAGHAVCLDNPAIASDVTEAAHTHSGASQDDANQKAKDAADATAKTALPGLGCGDTLQTNDEYTSGVFRFPCVNRATGVRASINVVVTITAGVYYGMGADVTAAKAAANALAVQWAKVFAVNYAHDPNNCQVGNPTIMLTRP